MNKILYSKTPRQLASEIIAVLGFILLSISFKAIDITDCNAGELLHQVQTMYEIPREVLSMPTKGLLSKVIKNYRSLDREFKDSLIALRKNEVGGLLLKLIYYNMRKNPAVGKIEIKLKTYIDSEDNAMDNVCVYGDGIYINTRKMSSYIGFCNGKISEMPETLDSLLFHELTHWFHGMTGCSMTNKSRFIKALMGKFMSKNSIRNLIEVWTNEEEMRTISGFFLIGGKFEFDPLNTNMYEIFKAHKLGIPIEQIRQRIFHVDYYSIPKILWETLHSAENFTIKPIAKLLDAIH